MVGTNRFAVCKEWKSLVIGARIEGLAKEESKNVGRLENFSPDVFLEQGAILIIPRDLIPITNNRFAIYNIEDFSAKEQQDEDIEDNSDGLPGSELCLHNSFVKSWAELQGNDFIIIGGYESGVDACHNLAQAGKRCTVLA